MHHTYIISYQELFTAAHQPHALHSFKITGGKYRYKGSRKVHVSEACVHVYHINSKQFLCYGLHVLEIEF